MKSKLFVLVLVVILTVLGATPITASPFHSASLRDFVSAPCSPGAAYDPACDANQDGHITIADIQLTAGHWDQTGTWTGSGDGWLLTGNAGTDPTNNFVGTIDGQPLAIQPGAGNVGIGTTSPQSKLSVAGTGWFQGSSTPLPAEAGQGVGIGYIPAWQAGYLFAFDYGTFTPKKLLLQSPGGDVGIGVSDVAPFYGKLQVEAGNGESGVYVTSAGVNGVSVYSAGGHGVDVRSAGFSGVYVGSAGDDGVLVSGAGRDGVRVQLAGRDGVRLDSAGGDGLFVCHTGTASTCSPSTKNNGVEIGNAQDHGVQVGAAGWSGVQVDSAGIYGVYVGSAGYDGVFVDSAVLDGVYANTTLGNGQWGFYTPDAIHGSNVLMHSLSLVAQVTGPDSLTPGDIVAVTGVTDRVPGSTVRTPLVRLAGGTFTSVVGVVESRLALAQQPSHPQSAEGETLTETPPSELRSVEGPARAGDYVAITVFGAAQVKVDSATPIEAGQRLTFAANGRTRPLGTIKVQLASAEGTADIAESAPVIGVALEAAKNSLVWVLVNPQ